MEIDGGRLRTLRLELMQTQADLARVSGVHEVSINRLEKGRQHRARISTVRKLAAALGVPPAELLTTEPEAARADDAG